MTLPLFDYVAPRTLIEALSILDQGGEASCPIAGGQSLMPVLAFRLASPSLLVDLRHLDELRGITVTPTGVTLGALVRWCDIERSTELATAHPLLVAAVSHIAHYQIRNRGTIGGSLAHADPAAELPGIAVACGANLMLASAKGSRTLVASDFFLGPLSTALEPGELIVAVQMPAWPAGRRWGFQEFARRRGDFALAGVALHYDVDPAGRAQQPRIGAIGIASTPVRLLGAEAALNGRIVDGETVAMVVEATRQEVDPPDDLHASARYRRALVGTLVQRALDDAVRRNALC